MGGGVVRTATKAAALAARGPWFEHVAGAARRSARPLPGGSGAVTGPAIEGAPTLSASIPAPAASVDASSEQGASWNVEGWEVVATEDEELFERPVTPVRLVFGPVPTVEEAREATTDLKDALEKCYFSPSTDLERSMVSTSSTLSASNFGSIDAKEKFTAILPSAPKHVTQAFSFLQGCPEAQDVVASIASDKNVWDAVLRNEKFLEFYKTHQINTPTVETDEPKHEYVTDKSLGKESLEGSENGFVGFVHSISAKVTSMINSLSDFIKDLIGTTETKKCNPNESNHFNIGLGTSVFALAVATILVILFKRG